MAAKQGKEVVGLETVKDKRERLILQNELNEMAEQKATVESIQNYQKTGTLDLLKKSVSERMRKLGLDGVWLKVGDYKHSLQPGSNTSISENDLKKAMMHYGVDPDVQSAILLESIKRTPYVSVMTKLAGEND